jgi:FkbM family methyltransferase
VNGAPPAHAATRSERLRGWTQTNPLALSAGRLVRWCVRKVRRHPGSTLAYLILLGASIAIGVAFGDAWYGWLAWVLAGLLILAGVLAVATGYAAFLIKRSRRQSRRLHRSARKRSRVIRRSLRFERRRRKKLAARVRALEARPVLPTLPAAAGHVGDNTTNRSEVTIDPLLAGKRLSSFVPLLAAYRQAGIPLHNAIDGGACIGETADGMLPYIDGLVYAFEPFPGNHRFFADRDERIVLLPYALAETRKTMAFHVRSIVIGDPAGRRDDLVGYSEVGMLVEDGQDGDITVQCVRGDAEIPLDHEISFVKLDLQGGELNALKGMTGLLPQCLAMWVEFTGQDGLLPYLVEQGYALFETEYRFRGEPDARARALFDVTRTGVKVSTGHTAWFGFKRAPWSSSYEEEFWQYRRELALTQTDLVCVHRTRLEEFQRAVGVLSGEVGETIR